MKPLWGAYQIALEQCRFWHVGALQFWLKAEPGQWWLWQAFGDPVAVPICDEECRDNLDSHRAIRILGTDDSSLTIVPQLPDRPLVLQSPGQLQLLPSASVTLLCYIPLWIGLLVDHKPASWQVASLPSAQLSHTWLGAPDGGEAGYLLPTPLRHAAAEPVAANHPPLTAGCTICVTNLSKEIIEVTHLTLHVECLQLYQFRDALFTNEVAVTFREGAQPSRVQLLSGAPHIEGESELAIAIGKPREAASDQVIKKGYNVIKHLTRLGNVR